MKNISNNIRLRRESKGISQVALAAEIGVSPQAVSKWERGESDPKWELAPKLAEFLGCTIDQLYGRAHPGQND